MKYQKTSTEFYLVDTENFEQVPTTVNIAWDGRYGAGDEIPFEITFFDENRSLLKDVRYAYFLYDENNKEIEANTGDDINTLGIMFLQKELIFQKSMFPLKVNTDLIF